MSSCPTGKICYMSKKIAKKAMKAYNKIADKNTERARIHQVYRCGDCSQWHLTSMTRTQVRSMNHKEHPSDELKYLREEIKRNMHRK